MNRLRPVVLLAVTLAFPAAPRLRATPFLRGDVNLDRVVDISDTVRVLLQLFHGVEATCEDRADFNDDGTVDLSDAVFGLEFLFLGGSEPPFPGALVPGFDATPQDPFPCGDPPLSECETLVLTSLPGVSIDVSDNPCSLTLQEAAAGVLFRFTVVVESEVANVTSLKLDAGRCDRLEESGLRTIERIYGGEQNYCYCDVGLCFPEEPEPVDLAPGRYESTFEWTGRNWFGPSDFLPNPQGPPFPPGRYRFEVRARGTYLEAGTPRPFELSSSIFFELIP